MGVIADQDLAPNTGVFYYGEDIDEKQLVERMQANQARYIIASGRKGEWIDANPDRPETSAFADIVAGRINEPAPKTTANMIILITMEGSPASMRPILSRPERSKRVRN